jgi:hypothetical protein
MSLLLGEVTSLLVGVGVWLAVVTVTASLPAFALGALRRRRPSGHELRWAVAGALLAAGIASRIGLDDPLGLALLRHPLPLVWVVVGAAGGAVLATLLPGRTAVSDRAAG